MHFFFFIFLLFWAFGPLLIHANSVHDKRIEVDVSTEKYSMDAWDVLVRNLQPEPSNEPIQTEDPTDFLLFGDTLAQESLEPSEENILGFPALTIEPTISTEFENNLDCIDDISLCEPEFGFEKSYQNEVTAEPGLDSDLIVIQSKDRPRLRQVRFARQIGLVKTSFRFPICVIQRQQMNCFIRKRCGFFRRNDRRVTGSRGPVFNWSRKRRCSSKCGFRAGRNCVSG